MYQAKAISSGSPILDPTAVFVPPSVGPLDYSHFWAAPTLRGLSAPYKTLKDMSGDVNLTALSNNAAFTDGATPYLTVNQSPDKFQNSSPGSAIPNVTTLMVVAHMDKNKTAQVTIPGWIIGGNASGLITVAGTGYDSFSESLKAGFGVYLFVLKDGEVYGYINGVKTSKTLKLNKNSVNKYEIGTNVWTSAIYEKYVAIKTWDRELTSSEISLTTNEAKSVFALSF